MDLTRKEERQPLAERMESLRKAAGRTQQESADALGVAQNTYAQMETAEIRFRRRDLVTLAVLYGMAPEDAFPTYFRPHVVAA